MHKSGLAGAIVADQSKAFASGDVEVDPGQGTDGTERFFDAVQSDCFGGQALFARDDPGCVFR